MTKPIKIGATQTFSSNEEHRSTIEILDVNDVLGNAVGTIEIKVKPEYAHLVKELEKLINKLEKK
jgi:hypothetical protein